MKRYAGLAALVITGSLSAVAAFTPRTPTSSATGLPYYADADFTPHWRPGSHVVPDFELRDQQARTVRGRDLRGRIHVASFFFTSCPSVCPALVARLRRVQQAALRWDDVDLVSFSVTPEADTPQRLAEFGRVSEILPGKWKLLTGERAQIARLFRHGYFADDRRTGDDRLLHTERVLLVDREGRLRGVYNGSQAFEMERLVTDIATLRAGA